MTKDRLLKWGFPVADTGCVLYNAADETLTHLYFQCGYSMVVFQEVCRCVQVNFVPRQLSAWKSRIIHVARKRNVKAQFCCSAFSRMISLLWRRRNARVHGQGLSDVKRLLFQLKRKVMHRLRGYDVASRNRGTCALMNSLYLGLDDDDDDDDV